MCINNYSQVSFFRHIKSILISIGFTSLTLFSLYAIADQDLTIEQLEKDASGNYLTPDSPIVQSLPEYNKNMKTGDVFKYSGTKYTIWGELLDNSEYNYIQPYRHGHCQYDASVWDPVRENNDWSQLPPCIKQLFIPVDKFFEVFQLPVQPYPRLRDNFAGFAVDPEIAKDKAMMGLLKDIQKVAKKMNVHIEVTDEYSIRNNIYLVDIDPKKLRDKEPDYPRVFDSFQKRQKDSYIIDFIGNIQRLNINKEKSYFMDLSDYVGFYPQNFGKNNAVVHTVQSSGGLDNNGSSNWVTDETTYLKVSQINFIQKKTMAYDDVLYNFVNYIPFTSQEYWDKSFYSGYFMAFSGMLNYSFLLLGTNIDHNDRQENSWNKGLWIYEPSTRFVMTLTRDGKFLVPDFILEGLAYVQPLDDVAIERLYYMIPPENEGGAQ